MHLEHESVTDTDTDTNIVNIFYEKYIFFLLETRFIIPNYEIPIESFNRIKSAIHPNIRNHIEKFKQGEYYVFPNYMAVIEKIEMEQGKRLIIEKAISVS